MKSYKFSFTFIGLVAIQAALSAEQTCYRCEEIREYNKTHHKNYEYYDDFLHDKPISDKASDEPSLQVDQAKVKRPVN